MYEQGKECICHEFIKLIIETEYRITAKPSTSENPMYNAVLERIHQVLGNLVWNFNISQTYVDEDDPWTVILAAVAFVICSTNNRQKGYSPGQLIFSCDIIVLIKQRVDWELIRQQNQMQINKDNIPENIHRVDHDYKVGDNVLITNHTVYIYETTYTCLFVMIKCFTNGTENV